MRGVIARRVGKTLASLQMPGLATVYNNDFMTVHCNSLSLSAWREAQQVVFRLWQAYVHKAITLQRADASVVVEYTLV